jgi:DNA-binding MarR family transcriptional regulator
MGHRLRRLHGLFAGRLGQWYRRIGLNITPVQGGILMVIDENPGLTQVAMARILRVEAPTVYQSLTPLVEDGYIERRPSSQDGRAMELYLSAMGRTALDTVRIAARDNEDRLLNNLTVRERNQLGELLDKALAGAEDIVDREKSEDTK